MTDPIAFLSELIALARSGETAVQQAVAARLAAIGCAIEALTYDPAEVGLREEFALDQAIASVPARRSWRG